LFFVRLTATAAAAAGNKQAEAAAAAMRVKSAGNQESEVQQCGHVPHFIVFRAAITSKAGAQQQHSLLLGRVYPIPKPAAQP
jgi:hypothetical protein